jgi:hypothetical protein
LWKYGILITMAAVLFIFARNFVKSRPGRALVAVRDNRTSAAVSGVNLPLYKTMAFGVSAAYGGLAGSMLMINVPFASDTRFNIQLAIFLVVGLVLGGIFVTLATLGYGDYTPANPSRVWKVKRRPSSRARGRTRNKCRRLCPRLRRGIWALGNSGRIVHSVYGPEMDWRLLPDLDRHKSSPFEDLVAFYCR